MANSILSPNGLTIKLPDKLRSFEPTHASRYWVVADILHSLNCDDSKVLDIGGKKGLLRLFPGYMPTIIDVEKSDEPNSIQGNALNMPFADEEFDVSISCDVLEHIPKAKREIFIKEALRVSKRYVIISAPFNNQGVTEAEQKANNYYFHLTHKKHQWLQEHIDNGIPEESTTEKVIDKLGYSYVKFRHFSLNVWQQMVSIHFLHAVFGDNKQVELLANNISSAYYKELCSIDFSTNGYRTFYVISKVEKINFALPPDAVYLRKRAEVLRSISDNMISSLEKTSINCRKLTKKLGKFKVQLNQLVAEKTLLTEELEKTNQQMREITSSRSWKMVKILSNPKSKNGSE